MVQEEQSRPWARHYLICMEGSIYCKTLEGSILAIIWDTFEATGRATRRE